MGVYRLMNAIADIMSPKLLNVAPSAMHTFYVDDDPLGGGGARFNHNVLFLSYVN